MQLEHLRLKSEGIVKEKRGDLVCQILHSLPSEVQHIAYTKDGAEGVQLWMIGTAPDFCGCHCGWEVSSERKVLCSHYENPPHVFSTHLLQFSLSKFGKVRICAYVQLT